MKKNLAIALCAVTATTMVLSGCGNSDETTSTPTLEESSVETTKQSTNLAELVEGYDLVYGKVNLPYADFYYGEINQIEPEFDATTAQLDAEDVVRTAGYEDEGMYDAVSSATTQKSTKYEQTYYEVNDSGAQIFGVANVNVAISKALYEDALEQIAAKEECSNPLLTIVENMSVTSDMPAEFKVIGSDGVLSQTIGNTQIADDAKASFSSVSVWGNYQISVEGIELDAATIQGGLLKTSDGSIYGLEHNDNLWLNAGEIAFAIKEFTEPHGNTPSYQRFEDMEGKTITQVVYMLADADDIQIDTNFFVNKQLDEQYGLTGDEKVTYSSNGIDINYSLIVPEDSNYELKSIQFNRADLDVSKVKISDDTISLPADFKPGSYTFTFEDNTYAGLTFSTLVDSGLNSSDISFDGSTFIIASDSITASDYIANISSVSIDGSLVEAKGLSAILFDTDGNINLDAEISTDEGTSPFFLEGAKHNVVIESTAYPRVSFSIER